MATVTGSEKPGHLMIRVMRSLDGTSGHYRGKLARMCTHEAETPSNVYRAIRTCIARGFISADGEGRDAMLSLTVKGQMILARENMRM